MSGFALYMLIFGVVAFARGAVALARELRRVRARAEMRRRLRAGAPQLADHSLITVIGTVRACDAEDALIEAPLSGRRVVFHRSAARVIGLDAEIVASELVPFELETADGIVRVEGKIADAAFPPLPVIPREIWRVQRLLAAHGIDLVDARMASVDEIAIEPGARIAVHGVARVEADLSYGGERGYREPAPVRVKIGADPDHPLTLGPA